MAIVRLKGLGRFEKKISTSSGLTLATFRLVAYCLNQLRYCVPHVTIVFENHSSHSYNHILDNLNLHALFVRRRYFGALIIRNVYNGFIATLCF
jgi:hypothetical protein